MTPGEKQRTGVDNIADNWRNVVICRHRCDARGHAIHRGGFSFPLEVEDGELRRFAANAILVIASVTLTLVAADIVMRMFSSVSPRSGKFEPTPPGHQLLTTRTATMAPHYHGLLKGRDFDEIPIETNRLGFRDSDYDLDALAGQRPVVFLGDSYIFGWGVERSERISERLADKLRAEGDDVPVLNMGLWGSGTYQAIDVLDAFARRSNPRLVVLGFFIGNDFLDNLAAAGLPGDEVAPVDDPADALKFIPLITPDLTAREVLRTSPIVNLVKYGLWGSSAFRSLFNRLDIRNDRIQLYAPGSSESDEALYGPTLQALTTFVERARELQVPVIVLLIPDHLQALDPQLFEDYDRTRPQRILAGHLESIGVDVIDLLPAFRDATDPQALYFREDKHWSAPGHELAAGILFDKIRSASGSKASAQ